jgi:DNA-binding NarL/FixJ family response regulator
MPVRILIADDHDELRTAIRNLLESRSGFKVCGEAKDGVQAVERSAEIKPDVVILDVIMPMMSGFEAARKIKIVSPDSRIVILSAFKDERLLNEAQNVGAICYVPKSEAARELIEAVQVAAEGRVPSMFHRA